MAHYFTYPKILGVIGAVILTPTEIGQAGLAILVAVIGYVLHRKQGHIEVMVDGRMTDALEEISELHKEVTGLNKEILGLKVERAEKEPVPPPPKPRTRKAR